MKLKPLTILTGVNSSGKSNIMEAASFLAQASRFRETNDQNPSVNAVLTWGDVKTYPKPMEDFIVYRKDRRKKVALEINLNPSRNLIERVETSLIQSDEARRYIFLNKNQTEIETVGYYFSFRLSDRTFSQGIIINGEKILEVGDVGRQRRKVILPKDFRDITLGHSLDSILLEDVFSPSGGSNKVFDVLSEISRAIVIYIRDQLKRLYFISGERGRIDPEFATEAESRRTLTPLWIGCDGERLVEILSECFTRETEKAKKIQKWASRFQLSDIRGGWVRGILESNFKDRVLNIDLNSALAGLGSRQILSVITQIFWSNLGDTIMIEEPEISLHPANQVLLHELFAEAISQGKQIICSTHSPFLVLALSRTVKKKLLTLDKIAVYHVRKGKDGTSADLLKLNKHGFIESGIPSFMKVEEELFQDWSESLEESTETTEEE